MYNIGLNKWIQIILYMYVYIYKMSQLNKPEFYQTIPLTTYKQKNASGGKGSIGPTGPAGTSSSATGPTGPSGTVIFQDTVNFNTNSFTNLKQQISYNNDRIIKESNIIATLDGTSKNGNQIYTFGPTILNRYTASSFDGTDNILSDSNDGINWNNIGTFTSKKSCIAYNGSMWLAGGNTGGSDLSYSYDGVHWIDLPTYLSYYNAIKWSSSHNMWIIVGGDDYFSIYSYDGINWTYNISTVFGPISSANATSIETNGHMFVAGGDNKICYSYDGITWYESTITYPDPTPPNEYIINIIWNGSLWLAGCSGPHSILYSNNGILWYPIPIIQSYKFSGGSCYSIGWNGKMFVAGGRGHSQTVLLYSYDGINWNNIDSSSIFENNCQKIIWDGLKWIAFGNNSSKPSNIAISSDGIHWSTIQTNNLGSSQYDVVFNNIRQNTITFQRDLMVATTSNGIIRSYDGINWLPANISNSNIIIPDINSDPNPIPCISYNGKMWVVGYLNSYLFSYDGILWYDSPSNNVLVITNQIIWDTKKWIACGSGSNSSIAISYDGITWIPLLGTNNILNTCNTISWNNDSIYIAGGVSPSNSFAISNDGITWTSVRQPNNIMNNVKNIVYNNIWLAVGSGSNTIAYSHDGLRWIGNGNNIFSNTGNKILCNGYKFVATGYGSNSIAWSNNGVIWYPIPSSHTNMIDGAYTVCWNGTSWFVGSSTSSNLNYATSYDGINWTYSINTDITTYGNFLDVKWSGSNYNNMAYIDIKQPIICGAPNNQLNTMAYSYDAIQWHGLGSSIINNQLNSVYFNGDIWIAVGNGSVSNLAYSYDGIHWNTNFNIINEGPSFNTLFDVTYNGTFWIVVGTIGIYGTSNDGINWNTFQDVNNISLSSIVWNGSLWVRGQFLPDPDEEIGDIYYSYNGINWTQSNYTSNYTPGNAPEVFKIIWNGKYFFCIANQIYILRSSNGIDWTPLYTSTYPMSSIASNYNLVVIGYKNTLGTAFSDDNGSSWTENTTSSNCSFNFLDICNSVTWNGSKWIASGTPKNPSDSSIIYSYDAINWFPSNNSQDLFLNSGVVYGVSNIKQHFVDNQFVLKKKQPLDIIASNYNNNGFNNVSIDIGSIDF